MSFAFSSLFGPGECREVDIVLRTPSHTLTIRGVSCASVSEIESFISEVNSWDGYSICLRLSGEQIFPAEFVSEFNTVIVQENNPPLPAWLGRVRLRASVGPLVPSALPARYNKMACLGNPPMRGFQV